MITVHELTKRFQLGDDQLTAVDQLSFEVGPGEVYGLLGPNGAGKTTSMRMILGLMRPDHGYAEIDGFRTSSHPDEVKRRVGFISASSGMYQWLTPREILLFFAEIYGVAADVAAERVETVARQLHCAEFLDRRSGVLSTGQKQRIKMARALVHDPPSMLLDEPTLGLDVLGSQLVFDYIRLVRDLGKSVILCTHSLEQAERVCDRFGLLHKGRLENEGTLSELQQQTGKKSLVDMFLQMLGSSGIPLTHDAA